MLPLQKYRVALQGLNCWETYIYVKAYHAVSEYPHFVGSKRLQGSEYKQRVSKVITVKINGRQVMARSLKLSRD